MSIAVFVMLGFLVGLVARALTPGMQSMRVGSVTMLGVGGALAFGLLSAFFDPRPWLELNATPVVFSVVGAIITVLIVDAAMGSRVRDEL